MNHQELCEILRTAEATSYGRPISSAAHTRILSALRQTRDRPVFSRHIAVAIGVGLLFTLHTSVARMPVARPSSALAFDASVNVELGDGGVEIRAVPFDAVPGGPRELP